MWYWSVEMQAHGIFASPAGPMESVLALGSTSLRMASSTAEVFMPTYLSAGRNSTTSSLMTTTVGFAALPVMTTAS